MQFVRSVKKTATFSARIACLHEISQTDQIDIWAQCNKAPKICLTSRSGRSISQSLEITSYFSCDAPPPALEPERHLESRMYGFLADFPTLPDGIV